VEWRATDSHTFFVAKSHPIQQKKTVESIKNFHRTQLLGKMFSPSLSRSEKIYSKYFYKKELKYRPMIHCKDYSRKSIDRIYGEWHLL